MIVAVPKVFWIPHSLPTSPIVAASRTEFEPYDLSVLQALVRQAYITRSIIDSVFTSSPLFAQARGLPWLDGLRSPG